jgi:hypothetical protein
MVLMPHMETKQLLNRTESPTVLIAFVIACKIWFYGYQFITLLQLRECTGLCPIFTLTSAVPE